MELMLPNFSNDVSILPDEVVIYLVSLPLGMRARREEYLLKISRDS
jgi:hypothetical protein